MGTLRHTQLTLFKQVPLRHILTLLSFLLALRKDGGEEIILLVQVSHVIKIKNLSSKFWKEVLLS